MQEDKVKTMQKRNSKMCVHMCVHTHTHTHIHTHISVDTWVYNIENLIFSNAYGIFITFSCVLGQKENETFIHCPKVEIILVTLSLPQCNKPRT